MVDVTAEPSITLGYLLPTREQVMSDRSATGPLLALAQTAEALGFTGLWVGDSLLARTRHDPLTLLAALAATTRRIALGTAILMPALRNPVVLAQQVATLDQLATGRLILGVGIGADNPAVRAEFRAAGVDFGDRLGLTLEGLRLCRALWSGTAVDWQGRWTLQGQTLGPRPHQPGGPPIWMASMVPAGLARTGRLFDGWLPIAPEDPEALGQRWQQVQASARDAGRADAVTAALYLTVALDADTQRAEAQLNDYLARYYAPVPGPIMRRAQACYAGPVAGLVERLARYRDCGMRHVILRFAGDQLRHLEITAEHLLG
jgi:alkanesulfonate monooxygenase SsuD/methylene tetrahydromethanopterin reductase-like flavin-dependent oxidoreductase (luciferase family)